MANIRPLSEDLQKVAETELSEVPKRIPDDLLALKTWIEQQPHLKARQDDQFLIQYLRGSKYSLEKAKTKLDIFFTLKSKFPDLFNVTDINDARFKKIYSYGFGLPLLRPLNDHGPRIFFVNFEDDIVHGQFDVPELFWVVNAMHEIIIMDDPYGCINGMIYIWDLKNISLNMAAKFTPSFLRKMVQFYDKSLPFRIKSLHMFNTPPFFHSVLNILIPLLSEKLKKRLFVYGHNLDDLQKNIPKKYLPAYLGGENGTKEELLKNFDQKWLEYKDYFKENENYGTEELLRPGKPIDFDSIYGLGGSFRKLDVD
ncbi:alpha-tocopherol transfer protein-like [Lucilia sericata]|uniref:alpha-tocopherol transfer protein-like n=1 Tax=Lucilia sericata TaxID=13632 RepID=UPI0018A813C4|nr:alpha-tocopherol transfer protein-like [Lucilia sericata]